MVNRITGSSGMDVESMVKSLMDAKRIPMDKLNQQKTTLNWTRDSYRELNSKFYDFRTNKLLKFGLSAEMNGYKVAVTGDTSAVKVAATANANTNPMTVSVGYLATQAKLDTTGLGYGLTKGSTLSEVLSKKTGIPVTDPPASPDKYDLKINNVAFSFANNLSISEVITEINTNTTAKATASFDELTGKLTILSKQYGATTGNLKLDYTTGGDNLLDLFGGGMQTATTVPADPADTTPPIITTTPINSTGVYALTGTNARVNINGTVLQPDSNTLTINGVVLTLLQKTANTSNPSVINTQADSTKSLETIKSFITAYNDVLNTLNTKVNEERYRNFAPLTDTDRAAMSDTDIVNWEAKAKSGMLKNDNILKSMMNNMRTEVSAKLSKLSAIGITTGQYYEGGKLYIDEEKLKKALENDPESIMNLFQGAANAPSEGLFDKLAKVTDTAMINLSDKAGTTKNSGDPKSIFLVNSSMGKILEDYNKRITAMQRRLDDQETRYYKQFTAMETAMGKLNSQSSLFATG